MTWARDQAWTSLAVTKLCTVSIMISFKLKVQVERQVCQIESQWSVLLQKKWQGFFLINLYWFINFTSNLGMSCPSWQWHRSGSSWSPVLYLPVAPLWCDLGFFPNSRGNKSCCEPPPYTYFPLCFFTPASPVIWNRWCFAMPFKTYFKLNLSLTIHIVRLFRTPGSDSRQ